MFFSMYDVFISSAANQYNTEIAETLAVEHCSQIGNLFCPVLIFRKNIVSESVMTLRKRISVHDIVFDTQWDFFSLSYDSRFFACFYPLMSAGKNNCIVIQTLAIKTYSTCLC